MYSPCTGTLRSLQGECGNIPLLSSHPRVNLTRTYLLMHRLIIKNVLPSILVRDIARLCHTQLLCARGILPGTPSCLLLSSQAAFLRWKLRELALPGELKLHISHKMRP